MIDAKRLDSVGANPNFLPVCHGKMVINVPYSVFRNRTSVLIPEEWAALKEKLSVMYPWLTVNAMDVIKWEIERTMKAKIAAERTAAQTARDMVARGDLKGALSWLEGHFQLEPEDEDSWYVYGEVLMKLGRKEEGFAALRKARNLSIAASSELKRTVRPAAVEGVDCSDHVHHRRSPRH